MFIKSATSINVTRHTLQDLTFRTNKLECLYLMSFHGTARDYLSGAHLGKLLPQTLG